uniref:Putative reverse transcriptase domain-containing protein n=1 Tax=Tanacetum cinerariifolium TaxID=118510 RepID=A0A6L2KMH6_TANCI|nr:putative reverse transcriptase domain-containing protein [Tanacetum cinerariifolium]
MEFQVEDRVMLKVLPWKGVVRFGKQRKLNPSYIGPFKVLAKVGVVSYKLELPQEFSRVHSTFIVSNLNKCYSDEPLAVLLDGLHIDDKLYFMKEYVEIIEQEVKRLKQSCILIFKANEARGAKDTLEILFLGVMHKSIHRLDTAYRPFHSERRIDLCSATGEWFKKDCIGSVTTWEDMVEKFIKIFYQLFDDNEEIEAEEDDDLDDTTDIFKIEGNLFDYETPLCKALNDFNYLLKIDTDMFTFDIQRIRTYEEYEWNNTMIRDLEKSWSDNGVPYQLCDHICELYRFKNRITKWPMCSLDVDGFSNGG